MNPTKTARHNVDPIDTDDQIGDIYAGQFICVHADGRVSTPADMDTILHNLHCEYPDMTHGHAGDLSDGGDKTLVWASQSESINDDGKRAIAEIVPA